MLGACPVLPWPTKLIVKAARGCLMAIVVAVLASNHVDAASELNAPTPARHFNFHIERTHLTRALRMFGELTHLQFAGFSDVSPADPLVGPVSGMYSPEDALTLLLDGTGLTFRFVNDRTIAIMDVGHSRQRQQDNNTRPSGVSPPAAPPEVIGSETDSAQSPESTSVPAGGGKRKEKHGLLSRFLGLFAVCTAATSPMSPACAQNADSSQQQSSPSELAEIVVTAERREDPISKVPVAITAITGDELKDASVTNAVQLQYLAPGMQVTQTGQGIYVAIRGVTTTDTTSKGEPGIQFNTDGIPVSRAEEQAIALFDLQRVEVLAGPQGTLYGKSSTGGAINVITNEPTQQEEASASFEVGNYETKRFSGMLNIPLTDNIAFRAAVNANYRDGYIKLLGGGALNQGNDNPYDENNVAGRFSLLGHFGEDTKLRLTFLDGRIGGVGFGNGDVAINLNGNGVGTGTTYAAWNPVPASVRDDFQKFNGEFNTAFGPVRLTYLGSYSHYRTQNNQSALQFLDPENDPNGASSQGDRLLVDDTYDSTYHELRFSNRDDGKLQWLAGVNYWWEQVHENGHNWQIATPTDCPDFSAYCTLLGAGGDPNYQNVFDLRNTTDHQSISAFVHAIYDLTPDWHVTVGAREGRDEISRLGTIAANWFQIGPTAPPPPTLYPNLNGGQCINTDVCVPLPGGIINNSGSGKSSKFVWTIGTDYRFTDTQFGYVTIATGYKAGGFNDVDPATGKFGPYAPESMTAYELGYKVRTPSGFSYTSSLYYYDYSNEQISANVVVNGNQFGLTLGVPTTLYGWENSLKWAFTSDDIVDLGLDLEHSKYNKFAFTPVDSFVDGTYGSAVPVDLSGRQLDKTPREVASLGYTHSWNLPNGARMQLHGSTRWSSSYVLTDWQTGLQYSQQSFTRSNADLTYHSSNDRMQTELFVTNIENKVQITGGLATYSSATQFPTGYSFPAYGQVSEPRFWGIRESIRF